MEALVSLPTCKIRRAAKRTAFHIRCGILVQLNKEIKKRCYFPKFRRKINPDILYRFYCGGARWHVYCVAPVLSPGHIV